ncbi:cupin domain-containing protein [Streptomyces sp. NPDC015127]|uniref:cupin domain-containing protein n=1 Tax=Streptomyces sp. NPDC015127 TaxID=3364939 RepID=UPI0037035030
MFVVILTYTAPVEEITKMRPDHLAWLDEQYASGLLIGSGRRVPREGAVMLARDVQRNELEAALAVEPYLRAGLARSEITEFSLSRGPLLDLPVVGDADPDRWRGAFHTSLTMAKGAHQTRPESCVLVRSGQTQETKQGLPTFAGVSQESAAAQALCLHVVMIPPGGRAHAHLHADHESAVYIVSGEADLWHGDGLGQHMVLTPGDFVYIPPSVPHLPANRSQTEPLIGVIARTDPNEQESVVLLPDLDLQFAAYAHEPETAQS